MLRLRGLVVALLLAAGCHHGSDGTGGAGGGSACPSGQVVGSDGSCLSVGIQGCDPTFVDADGVCRPSVTRCPAGTIPSFTKGCMPVGISGCAKEFLGSDGICHPTSAACGAGTFPVPQKGCVSIDGPAGCGAAPWGNIPDGPDNVYVDPTAAPGGDGSKAKPLTTLTAALAMVATGGRIALAAGEYKEAATLDKAVEIAGRCPSLVTIDGSGGDPSLPTVIVVQGGPVTIRGVRISGDGVGVTALAPQLTTLDGVVIDGALGLGVGAFGGNLAITSSYVHGTRSQGGIYGRGIDAEDATKITVTDSAVVGNRSEGVWTTGAKTTMALTDVLVEGTLAEEASGNVGEGLAVEQGAVATLTDCSLSDNRYVGINIFDAGTQVTLVRTVVEGTHWADSNMHLGVGVQISAKSSVSISASVLSKNHNCGLLGADVGTKVTVDGSLVVDTLGDPNSLFGRGINVTNLDATVTDSTILRARDDGLAVFGGTVQGSGLLVEDTQPDGAGQFGTGVLTDEGHLSFSSLAVTGARVAAVFVADGNFTASQSWLHATVAGAFTLHNPDTTVNGAGDGLLATVGSTASMDASFVEGCARAGLLFDSSTGSVTNSASTGNVFGVVIDGTSAPMIDTASTFAGNSQDGRKDDAALPVPTSPAAVPPG